MTTFLLIRHASHQLGSEVIPGRAEGVNLSEAGRQQAGALAERLSKLPIRAICSSPMERASETAAALSDRLDLPVEVSERLSEIDYGEWTGKSIAELRTMPEFARWNEFRSGARIPGGELMIKAQARVVAEMQRLRVLHPGDCVAVFSHGDVIRAAVAHWLGVPLDLMLRIRIDLASVSVVRIDDSGPAVICVNHTGDLSIKA